jgi:hypothetical protein
MKEDVPAAESFEVFDNITGAFAGRLTRDQLCCFLKWHLELNAETGGDFSALNDVYIVEEALELISEKCPDRALLDVLANATKDQHEAVIRWIA